MVQQQHVMRFVLADSCLLRTTKLEKQAAALNGSENLTVVLTSHSVGAIVGDLVTGDRRVGSFALLLVLLLLPSSLSLRDRTKVSVMASTATRRDPKAATMKARATIDPHNDDGGGGAAAVSSGDGEHSSSSLDLFAWFSVPKAMMPPADSSVLGCRHCSSYSSASVITPRWSNKLKKKKQTKEEEEDRLL